jgi:DNA-binding response OmpR family regulator
MKKNTKKEKTKKILIIEDESMIRDALVDNLREEGYQVFGSESVDAAFKQMREERPDIILTDLVMSKIDGYEFLHMIKEDEAFKEIPVLVLSNLGEPNDIARALSLGAQDFMVKSNLSLKEVTARVKKALS